MNSEQLRQFRVLLEKEREAVLHRLKTHQQSNTPEYVGDLADKAETRVEQTTNESLVHSEDQLLKKIEFALKRIEEGEYGVCIRCGENIPVERLRAKPSASLCVPCQNVKEGVGG